MSHRTQLLQQLFYGPIWLNVRQVICRSAVLLNAETNCGHGIESQGRLSEQSSQVTRQYVTASALSQKRIAGTVDKHIAGAPSDNGLVAFKHDDTLTETAGQLPDRFGPVGLNSLGRGS